MVGIAIAAMTSNWSLPGWNSQVKKSLKLKVGVTREELHQKKEWPTHLVRSRWDEVTTTDICFHSPVIRFKKDLIKNKENWKNSDHLGSGVWPIGKVKVLPQPQGKLSSPDINISSTSINIIHDPHQPVQIEENPPPWSSR